MTEGPEVQLKTINEFRDPGDPNKVLVAHKSVTGEEPVYVDRETFVAEDKIDKGCVAGQEVSRRLDELVSEYYMFALAPVYLACLWDRSANKIKMDLIYQYTREMKLASAPKLAHYTSDTTLFHGGGGLWDCLLQGIFRGDSNVSYLFPEWAKQLVFVDRNTRPMQYWRVNVETIRIWTPSTVAKPVDIDIFLPSGADKRLGVSQRKDGSYNFVQLPPEDWVVEESMRYFGGVEG